MFEFPSNSQVRSDILSENIYCPAEKAVLMASYQVQAKYGDYDGVDKHSAGYLANEKLLPAKILSQHKLSIQEWEEKVGGSGTADSHLLRNKFGN